jgi:hypothetical protein
MNDGCFHGGSTDCHLLSTEKPSLREFSGGPLRNPAPARMFRNADPHVSLLSRVSTGVWGAPARARNT